jgi:hypothetical protein
VCGCVYICICIHVHISRYYEGKAIAEAGVKQLYGNTPTTSTTTSATTTTTTGFILRPGLIYGNRAVRLSLACMYRSIFINNVFIYITCYIHIYINTYATTHAGRQKCNDSYRTIGKVG